MTIQLEKWGQDRGVEYFLISYSDLYGVQRSKLVPTTAIADMQKNGAGFAGFATYLDLDPSDPDMIAMPDPQSVMQLPWNKKIAWVAANPMIRGQDIEHAPRNVLRRMRSTFKEMGYSLFSGIEPEFLLLTEDGKSLSDDKDTATKPCYDQLAVMRRLDVIKEICDSMIELGWEPYQNDHEDANGQFEINWGFGDCLETADRHAFSKFMIQSIAEQHGYRATFMPKPFSHLTGNGCHVHYSIWDDKGEKPLFSDAKGELGLADIAYNLIASLLKNAVSYTVLTNPTINSYKRLNASTTASGATWSPNAVTYSGNNRSHMIRIPADNRVELRVADGATNPYLLQAIGLACAIEGISKNLNPGKRLDVNMFVDGKDVDCDRLPQNLLDSLRLFKESKFIKEYFGEEFQTAFYTLKMEEWKEYTSQISEWEFDNALNC